MNINKKAVISIIFIAFITSCLLSYYFVNLYDGYNVNGVTHIMLKEETFYHWYEAAKIIEQIKSGKSAFIAGGEVFTKPLPQRLVALYAYITDLEIIENWQNLKINLGGKLPFLLIQSTIYYLAVFVLFKQIINYFSKEISFFIILFLCFEPTIFQYHSSFWTESFYFSIQLFILAIILNQNNSYKNLIIIGLLLGLLFIQRSVGIFYIVVVSLYYLFDKDKPKFKKILFLLIPYLVICIFLGLHNYKRVGVFYMMPTEGKYGMYKYFAKNILAEANNVPISEVNRSEVNKSLIWMKKNLPNLDHEKYIHINSPYEVGLSILNEEERIKFWGYLNKRAYQILVGSPFLTLKKTISGFMHFSVLNPSFVYYDYEYFKNFSSSIIGDFSFSEQHKKIIPLRIIYTSIIFLICFIGFVSLYKKNSKLALFLLFSVIYYYVITGWYGKTRLFAPCLIYLSIFFGHGLNYCINKLNNKKQIE